MSNGFAFEVTNYLNSCVLAIVVASVVIAAGLTYWMYRNEERRTLPIMMWVLTLSLILLGLRGVLHEGESHKQVLHNFYIDVVEIVSQLTEEKEHHLLKLDTPLDDPRYQSLLAFHESLCKERGSIGYIYTLRQAGPQKTVYVCDSEIDVNGDGYIDGETEIRLPPGAINDEWFDIFQRGFNGNLGVDTTVSPVYGEWITVVVPLHDPQGKVEAILCVDFHPQYWNVVMGGMHARSLVIFAAALLVFYLGCYQVAVQRIALRALQSEHEKLLVAEKNALVATEAKQCFLTNINREVRTPMNAILGMTQIIQSKVSEHVSSGVSQEINGLMRLVQKNGETLLELIDGILELSQVDISSTKLNETWFPIRALLAEIVAKAKPTATARGLLIAWDCPSATPVWVKSDAAKITRILWLLIDNAIKFTPSGSVTIRAALVELPPSAADDAEEKPEGRRKLRLQVHDTGVGISPEKQASLFEAFSQIDSSSSRRYGGVGIGLAIVARLSEILHGQIELNSQPGVGTVLQLSLDVAVASGERPSDDDDAGMESGMFSGTFGTGSYGTGHYGVQKSDSGVR